MLLSTDEPFSICLETRNEVSIQTFILGNDAPGISNEQKSAAF